ncbi:aspartate aminotransferase, cytoplasmic-like [Mytilus californianus]|uniref:aspartate aminotransferase, cytoplasmic-like n=1 Tax=Mytilus californianus TaxID=6549 RepID=UPI002245C72D|nr:aspartate aminotransferase, cytoplasmic-like [Mytilus californianus]
MDSGSVFADIEGAPAIEVFKLIGDYNEDTFDKKVNLGVGAYRTDEGKPWVLPVVKTVEAMMAGDAGLNHEYLPISGLPDYRTACQKLLLGSESPAIQSSRVESFQACGGTGAIRLAADFLKRLMNYDCVYVSKPTWGNHKTIFKRSGFSDVREYRYWHPETKSLDFQGMLEDLNNAPERSVVILHGVAHNPTGVDPTKDQWVEIIKTCQAKNIFILVDIAYQGFATGDLDADAHLPRYLDRNNIEFMAAQSFSKNFGLYNERTGNLVVVCANSELKAKIRSQMELIIRTTWSNPPNHGARIVTTVLNNPANCAEWKEHIKEMASRIKQMRQMLHAKLKALGTPGNWDHIIQQIGMFSFTGLSPKQVEVMINKYHIYLLKEGGRINMCALTTSNIDYVAKSIHSVVTEAKL